MQDAADRWSSPPGGDDGRERVPDPSTRRIVVVVVAYEAAATIERLLDRIPATIGGVTPTVLVADDASEDDTVARARAWADGQSTLPVTVVRHPRNLGYGGNQKAGFQWTIDGGFDIAVLLHGDEQYPPERISELIDALDEAGGVAAFGTRMAERGAARRGGMPRRRLVGNRVLSRLLNHLTGATLTEWFNGFRAYRTTFLSELDLSTLPDGFDFDTAITVRALTPSRGIVEVPMPTRYADEISRVPLLRTGLAAIVHGVRAWRSRASDPSMGAGGLR